MRSSLIRRTVMALLAAVATSAATQAYGDDASKPRVAVIEFSNETGSASYDAASRSATDTLLLTLRELGRYAVQAESSPGRGDEALRAMAADRRLDFVMYGRLTKPSSGGIECSLSVYDRAKGKTSLSKTEKATGVLDIFDATDTLVVSVLEAMTGSHIGFGAITLLNAGEKGSYSVLLDGSLAGKDLASFDKVLIGKRTIAIKQDRMLGEREIARFGVEVKEGQSVELKFALPLLMDDEKAKLEALKAAVKAGWNDVAKTGEVDTAVAELGSLLKDTAYSPGLSSYGDAAKQTSGEWALQKIRLAIEEAAWDPKLELLDPGNAVYAAAKGYSHPDRIRSAFEEEARLEETLFDLKAGQALGDGDADTGLECLADALIVSARYLRGGRITDYAYAVSTLKGLQDMYFATGAAFKKGDRNLEAVFGDMIRAGQRFYGLKDSASSGAAAVLVASDFRKALSVDGGDFADAPCAAPPVSGLGTLSVKLEGEAKSIVLAGDAKRRILFVQDGFSPFGKVTLSAAPGAIDVSASFDSMLFSSGMDLSGGTITCSLDGGEEVELPHVFEGVPAGHHVIRIPELSAGRRLYAAFEQDVVVEPGQRLAVEPKLRVGRGKLRVEGIPEGATLLVDDIEQEISKDSSGALYYEDQVDAGTPQIEVVKGNKTWHASGRVGDNDSEVYRVQLMPIRITLQGKAVKLKGKAEDWAGVEDIFGPAPGADSRRSKFSGSVIAGGTACRDGKYLYVRIDFADGKPRIDGHESWRLLRLSQGGYNIHLQMNIWSDGSAHSSMWEERGKKSTECGRYVLGPSFIELQFPLAWIPKYFDLAKPFQASVAVGDPKYWCESPKQEIYFGD